MYNALCVMANVERFKSLLTHETRADATLPSGKKERDIQCTHCDGMG